MIYLPRDHVAKNHRDTIRSLAHMLANTDIDDFLNRAAHAETDQWPNRNGDGRRGSGVSKPTEAVAVRDAGGHTTRDGEETDDNWDDPTDPVREAIAHLFAELSEAAGIMKRVEQRRQWLANIRENARTRTNTIDLCAECNDPIQPPQKTKRLDGQPYHHPDPVDGFQQPQCWWHAYRRNRPDTMAG